MPNIKDSFATKAIAIAEVRAVEIAAPPIKELLKDYEVREIFLQFGREITNILGQAFDSRLQLKNHSKCNYLLDFDILRRYLELGSIKTAEAISVKWLFNASKRPYAIPLGSFYELVEWFTDEQITTDDINSELMQASNKSACIREIAKHLSIKHVSNKSDDDTLAEILHCLENKYVILTRLNHLLNNKRFLGIEWDYNKKMSKSIKKIISRIIRFRPDGQPRKKRSRIDKRDSINIAIAINSNRCDNRNKGSQQFVLLSQTAAVTNLHELINSDDPLFSHEAQAELSKILDTKDGTLGSAYPVISVKQAICSELLGIDKDSNRAFLKANRLRDAFNKITINLQNEAILYENTPSSDDYEQKNHVYLEKLRQQIEDTISDITHDFGREDSVVYDLIRWRANETFEELAAHLQHNRPLSALDKVRLKTTDVLGLLRQITDTLSIFYETTITDTDPNGYYKTFAVQQKSGSQKFNILEGDIYGLNKSNVNKYYSLRWPIVCNEKRFFSALSKTLTTISMDFSSLSNGDEGIQLTPLIDESDHWIQGIILYTSEEPFSSAISLNTLADGRDLYLESVGRQLEKSYKYWFPEVNSIPEIQQYRVNTIHGDFLYDVYPGEYDDYRYISVISHYNLALPIALLYAYTGTRSVSHPNLRDELLIALKDFDRIPDILQSQYSVMNELTDAGYEA